MNWKCLSHLTCDSCINKCNIVWWSIEWTVECINEFILLMREMRQLGKCGNFCRNSGCVSDEIILNFIKRLKVDLTYRFIKEMLTPSKLASLLDVRKKNNWINFNLINIKKFHVLSLQFKKSLNFFRSQLF